jgi:hypothetical protein
MLDPDIKIQYAHSFEFPYWISAYTVKVPPPSSDPSGVAKVRFINRINEPVWIWLEGGIDGRYGYIHLRNLGANRISSKISTADNSGLFFDFDIPASRYKIKVLWSGDAVSPNTAERYKLYELDSFDFPSAIDRYVIELDPVMKEEEGNRTSVTAQITIPKDDTGTVPVQAKIELGFSVPMIPALVEKNVQLYKENNLEDVLFNFSWMDQNKKVVITTFEPLQEKKEYKLELVLNMRDKNGNRLEDAKEEKFVTGSVIITTEASPVTVTESLPDDKKSMTLLYVGLRTGFSPRDYLLNTTLPDITAETHTAFEIAALAEVRILSLLSLQIEFIFSSDEVDAVNPSYGDIRVSASTLTIPLLAKLTFRPGKFYFAVFTGPAISLPLGQMEVTQGNDTKPYGFSATPGWVGGANAGIKLGQGLLFVDARYSGDFLFVQADKKGQYRRNIFSISLGYDYGLITKTGGR